MASSLEDVTSVGPSAEGHTLATSAPPMTDVDMGAILGTNKALLETLEQYRRMLTRMEGQLAAAEAKAAKADALPPAEAPSGSLSGAKHPKWHNWAKLAKIENATDW